MVAAYAGWLADSIMFDGQWLINDCPADRAVLVGLVSGGKLGCLHPT